MASSILNSDDGVISGTSGLKSTGGDDGVLKIQNNGTDAITVADDGEVTLAAGLTVASPIIAAAGTALLPVLTTTGDLNTGIYFPSADTIGFAEGGAQCGEFDSSANFKFNSGYGSVATAYGCRAWVNFNASSGTPTIRSSGNVSSLTDEPLGKFTINFSTVLPDANYSVIATTGNTGSTGSTGFCGPYLATSTSYQSKTTSSVYMGVLAGNNAALLDLFDVNVAIFR